MRKILLPLCAALSSMLLATEYFVSTNGDDKNNPGTSGKPFKTIKQAVSKVVPGDIITVRGGEYREFVTIKTSGTADKPIVLRGAPGETATLNAGFPVNQAWTKTEGRRFVWEIRQPHSVNMLWESLRLCRYMEVTSLAQLDLQPGAFFTDRARGFLYIHALSGFNPNHIGIVVVPFYVGEINGAWDGSRTGDNPLPFKEEPGFTYRWNKGIHVTGSHVIVENFTVKFYPGQGIRISNPAVGCIVRSNTVLGTTCGIMDYGAAGTTYSRNRLIRNAGIGILLNGNGRDILVEDNFLDNNGPSLPLFSADNSSAGHLYNLAHYGSYTNVKFLRNLVLSDDGTRRYGRDIMRCKGGINGHMEHIGNVLVGGGVDVYAASPESTANICNNTLIGGAYHIATRLSNGDVYKPHVADNLTVREEKNAPLFADVAHLDYRQSPDSPCLGRGAYPDAGGFVYVKNMAELQTALSQDKEQTIYLEPGTYTGSAVFSGTKTVRIADKGKKTVLLLDFSLSSTQGNLEFNGPVFKNSRLQLAKASFQRCVLDKCVLKADDASLVKCSILESNANAQKILLRDCVTVGACNITGIEAIRENNATLKALDADYRLPPGSPLAYGALDGGAVGGRPGTIEEPAFAVEELMATPILPDRVRISWKTPYGYCTNVSIRGKNVPPALFRQDSYYSTIGVSTLKGLKPDTDYTVSLFFYTVGSSKCVAEKQLSFKTPATAAKGGRTLRVAAGELVSSTLAKVLPGDTVVLAPGEYTEALRLDVDGITLKSEIPDAAHLSAGRYLPCILQLDEVSDVVIEGIRFSGANYSASDKSLSISGCRNITVRKCYFDGDRARGGKKSTATIGNIQLFAHKMDGLTVSDCIFNSGFHGIWIYPAKNVRIFNNTFWGIGINGIHVGCEQGDKVEIFNNIFEDVVSNHESPAITVAEFGKHVYSDYNLFWNTEKRCPKQGVFGFGRYKDGHEYSAPWHTMKANITANLADTRKRFALEKHSLYTAPRFIDYNSFALPPDSPAIGAGRDGAHIGARQ